MIYRFNRLFNVSKRRAATVAVLTAIEGIIMLPLGADFGSVAVMFFLWSAIYGGIWYYKYNRDKKVLARQTAMASAPVEAEQSMTTPNSSHLFVPNPLDRH